MQGARDIVKEQCHTMKELKAQVGKQEEEILWWSKSRGAKRCNKCKYWTWIHSLHRCLNCQCPLNIKVVSNKETQTLFPGEKMDVGKPVVGAEGWRRRGGEGRKEAAGFA